MTDIVIAFYGDRKDLDRCLESIKAHCSDYALHVIDNNTKNIGFTAAMNKGIKEGSAEYIWVLNQDVVVLEGAQQALIDRLNYHPKVGIAGSMQLDPNNPDRIAHGGTNACFPAGKHKGGFVSMGHCRFPEKQTWVNGASMMIKRKLVNEIGPMDPGMFLLYSDSDYCYEARANGWEVWYEPRSVVMHTLGKASKNSAEWQQKDMIAFMNKWGIRSLPNGGFEYSKRFQKLDMFP